MSSASRRLGELGLPELRRIEEADIVGAQQAGQIDVLSRRSTRLDDLRVVLCSRRRRL